MPVGRATPDRDRRARRGDSPAARRAERARRGTAKGRRPGGKPPGRRPRSGTGGAFKLSSTRRAAVLAMLVCAMALSVSVPLRTYLSQREELADQQQQQARLQDEVRNLQERKRELSDPAHLEAEARARLGYVRPGETPYVVQVPETTGAPPPKPATGDLPWYEELWNSVMGKGS
ncbi:FtsB family cell division protein [Saccharopolyspora rosea]|uniref:Septum formation initiator family protein n=1 Tax=Saccharopolyspora rosea TaxID=524884 RepID=A0ABW3FLW2_9PSEU|nr:septum formation initiator family protein [Saccharopolyspora rosea]